MVIAMEVSSVAIWVDARLEGNLLSSSELRATKRHVKGWERRI